MNLNLDLANISLVTFVTVFAAGVITSFTPCVYPLIPIIIGYIGPKELKSRAKTLFILLFYCLGIAINFSILGLVASLTGKLFGEVQSSPLAHIVVGNIIVFFGLSLLGVFTIPSFQISKKINKDKSGTPLGAFGMGFASGLIAAPCTSAVLGALLAFVATKQNVLVGAGLLFSFAIGLSAILLIAGLTSTEILRSSGFSKFSGILEKVFGFLMILLGEYFIFKAGMLSV